MNEAKTAPGLDAALAHMAPIISHEIRNPLAIIGNSSYFIKTKLSKEGELDPKIARHFEIIATELGHANETLGEILAYARMPEPKAKAEGLNALVCAVLRELPPPPGVTLKQTLAKEEASVLADAPLFGKSLGHVLRNAYQAASAAGKSGGVALATAAGGGRGFVEVSNSGAPLAAEVRAKLYSAFNTDKPRGIGLGLAFADKALARMGGSIELLDFAEGAAFRLNLPLA